MPSSTTQMRSVVEKLKIVLSSSHTSGHHTPPTRTANGEIIPVPVAKSYQTQVEVKHVTTMHGPSLLRMQAPELEQLDPNLLRLVMVWGGESCEGIPGFQKPAGAVSSFKSNGVGSGLMARL